jgi:hypothetical protein
MFRKYLGSSLDAKIGSDGRSVCCVCNTVRTPMRTLESVCSPSTICPDHIADAEVSELPFADHLDALGDAQVSSFEFVTRLNVLEDVCNLKCARPDAHLTHPDGT